MTSISGRWPYLAQKPATPSSIAVTSPVALHKHTPRSRLSENSFWTTRRPQQHQSEAMRRWPVRWRAPLSAIAKPARNSLLLRSQWQSPACARGLTTSRSLRHDEDSRLKNLGREISDDYASIRETYGDFRFPKKSCMRNGLTPQQRHPSMPSSSPTASLASPSSASPPTSPRFTIGTASKKP
ncbi:hypothetical protein G7046_g9573 [Stylonectria norvegica]|nr:hypothetical protein G7046_g9573 [Stylonectria norvegica]